MGKWCLSCSKMMKKPEMTHCSDECVLKYVKKSKSKLKSDKGAESWREESDPWK